MSFRLKCNEMERNGDLSLRKHSPLVNKSPINLFAELILSASVKMTKKNYWLMANG